MKCIYIGWVVVAVLGGVGLLVMALGPEGRRPGAEEQQLADVAKKMMERGPAPEPGEGRVTVNLSRAMRMRLPIAAVFPAPDEHAHGGGAEQLQAETQEQARHLALMKLAVDYNGAAAIVVVNPQSSPASVVREKVTPGIPTIIIYGGGPDHRELWRQEGEVGIAQVRAQMVKLGIKPPRPVRAGGSR